MRGAVDAPKRHWCGSTTTGPEDSSALGYAQLYPFLSGFSCFCTQDTTHMNLLELTKSFWVCLFRNNQLVCPCGGHKRGGCQALQQGWFHRREGRECVRCKETGPTTPLVIAQVHLSCSHYGAGAICFPTPPPPPESGRSSSHL